MAYRVCAFVCEIVAVSMRRNALGGFFFVVVVVMCVVYFGDCRAHMQLMDKKYNSSGEAAPQLQMLSCDWTIVVHRKGEGGFVTVICVHASPKKGMQ